MRVHVLPPSTAFNPYASLLKKTWCFVATLLHPLPHHHHLPLICSKFHNLVHSSCSHTSFLCPWSLSLHLVPSASLWSSLLPSFYYHSPTTSCFSGCGACSLVPLWNSSNHPCLFLSPLPGKLIFWSETASCLEGSLGENQLLDGPISPLPFYPGQRTNLPVRSTMDLHQFPLPRHSSGPRPGAHAPAP